MAPKITGTFTVSEVPDDHHLVFISTGTGIAPYMSMLRTPQTWKSARRISLIHGVRNSRELAYRTELETLVSKDPRFAYYPIVSREDPAWSGARGHVQKLFQEGIIKLNPEVDHVFICGNPAMIEDNEARLKTCGYTIHSRKNPGNLHLEKYW